MIKMEYSLKETCNKTYRLYFECCEKQKESNSTIDLNGIKNNCFFEWYTYKNLCQKEILKRFYKFQT